MDHFHFTWRHLRVDTCHAFACSFIITIGDKVLSGCCYLMVVLHTTYHFYTQFGNQIRRLAVYFFVASPALVATYVQYRCIHIGISQHACFPSGDQPYLVNQPAIPGMSQPQLGREVGSFITFHSANPFIGEVGGNAEPCFFYKKSLDFIQCPGMAGGGPYVFIVGGRKSPLLKTIQMFVNSSDSVFPQLVFPFGSRQIIL